MVWFLKKGVRAGFEAGKAYTSRTPEGRDATNAVLHGFLYYWLWTQVGLRWIGRKLRRK